MSRVTTVISREALEERFGEWPSFHDAEIQAVRMDSGQRSSGRPSIQIDIHVFRWRDAGEPRFFDHTLVTFRFEGVTEVEMTRFGHQNVLMDLAFEDAGPGWRDRTRVRLP